MRKKKSQIRRNNLSKWAGPRQVMRADLEAPVHFTEDGGLRLNRYFGHYWGQSALGRHFVARWRQLFVYEDKQVEKDNLIWVAGYSRERVEIIYDDLPAAEYLELWAGFTKRYSRQAEPVTVRVAVNDIRFDDWEIEKSLLMKKKTWKLPDETIDSIRFIVTSPDGRAFAAGLKPRLVSKSMLAGVSAFLRNAGGRFLTICGSLMIFSIPATLLLIILILTGIMGRNRFEPWELILVYLVAASGFVLLAWDRAAEPTKAIHFVMQSHAFLKGHFSLPVLPFEGGDYSWREGCRWAPNPAFPAVMMMPFFTLMQYELPDIVFGIAFSSLTVAAFYALLEILRRRGYSVISRRENIWLVLLFAFGTQMLTSTIEGRVWFTAHVVSALMCVFFLLSILDFKHPVLAGICVACAILSRPNMGLMPVFAVFMGILILYREGAFQRPLDMKKFWTSESRAVLLCGIVAASGVLVTFLFNYARFGEWFDSGYGNLAGGDKSHGLFSLHWATRNLTYVFLNTPVLEDRFPWLNFSPEATSVFMVSPALLYVFSSHHKNDLRTALILTLLALIVPLALYYGTGRAQFGYRRLTDFMPMIVMLIAISRRRLGRLFYILVILSVLINIYGVFWQYNDWKMPDWDPPF